MNPMSFICIVIGVSLNACAQLLLKAGVNAVGHFDFTPANIIPVGFKIATQLPIIGGLACYVLSVVVWIVGLSRVDVVRRGRGALFDGMAAARELGYVAPVSFEQGLSALATWAATVGGSPGIAQLARGAATWKDVEVLMRLADAA